MNFYCLRPVEKTFNICPLQETTFRLVIVYTMFLLIRDLLNSQILICISTQISLIKYSGSQRGKGLQGSGPKKAGLQGSKARKSGLQSSIETTFRAPGSTARNDQGSRLKNDWAPGSTAKNPGLQGVSLANEAPVMSSSVRIPE